MDAMPPTVAFTVSDMTMHASVHPGNRKRDTHLLAARDLQLPLGSPGRPEYRNNYARGQLFACVHGIPVQEARHGVVQQICSETPIVRDRWSSRMSALQA